MTFSFAKYPTTDDDETPGKRKVVLEQEFPDYDIILQRAEASLTQNDTPQGCPHLLEFLPHTLSLELAQSTTIPNHWMLLDPVHALHLTSQFRGSEEFRTLRDMPMLYGEEQERKTVLQMRGFTDVHHPYTHDWDELHQHERDAEETKTEKVVPEVPFRAKQGEASQAMGPPLPRSSLAGTNDAFVGSAKIEETAETTPITNDPSKQTVSMKPESFSSTHLLVANLTPAAEPMKPEITESAQLEITEPGKTEVTESGKTEVTESAKPETKETIPTDPAPEQPSSLGNTSATVVDSQETKATATPTIPYKSPERLLDENRYWSLHTQEAHIEKLRTTFLSKRMGETPSSKKKRKSDSKPMALQYMMAWREHRPYLHKIHDTAEYRAQQERARRQTQLWMDQYRHSRMVYWQQKENPKPALFGAIKEDLTSSFPGQQCQECRTEDSVMQCLECSVTARGPDRLKHMLRHNLETDHNFAVTCDRQAKVYCFACGDYVQHEIFDAEKERIDLTIHLPWLSWQEQPVQRSFDAYRFIQIPDQGIFWRGMYATYPSIVPDSHVRGARACRRRQIVFRGEIEALPSDISDSTRIFLEEQQTLGPRKRFHIPAPVGMYNLGNTCYQSSVLQCLMACPSVQKYFLEDLQHPFATCQEHRSNSSAGCLACAMDRLMLQYFGSARGINALAILEERDDESQLRGDPLVGSEMLFTTWKCPGMSHLAGYEQRDAHEFLHGFLDSLSKSDTEFHSRIHEALGHTETDGKAKEVGLVKNLFDGSFRSVLICQECHNKRSQTESFMSISLPLSKEVERQRSQLSVESCLQSFTTPETLTDPVDCPFCRKKTETKQQHVIRRLPRLLVLHLKRFDNNRKMEDLVSFPEHVNMGVYLPHWCEEQQIMETTDSGGILMPDISYELVGTVNHYGTLTSGHYTSSVKVQHQWYRINDQHVSLCDAKQVLENEAAYLLFYFRK